MSGTEITRKMVEVTMNSIESFLNFTTETGEDFPEGWLPTLDTSLKVGEHNQVLFRFYEKPTSSKMTVQKDTAMCENSKIQILSNDVTRRLLNSCEELGSQERERIIDQYGQKLLNSGYAREQVVAILVAGIKGYEGKGERCKREGRNLRRTSDESKGARTRKTLLGKTEWYKRRSSKRGHYAKRCQGKRGAHKEPAREQEVQYKTVLFVEYSKGGELAARLREVMKRLAPLIGFGVKIVERAGRSLRSCFPLTSLWDGAQCGRSECITCNQGGEKLPPCTRRSLVYENVCKDCNQGAGGKEEIVPNMEIPSIYVGETSRTIQERGMEH